MVNSKCITPTSASKVLCRVPQHDVHNCEVDKEDKPVDR